LKKKFEGVNLAGMRRTIKGAALFVAGAFCLIQLAAIAPDANTKAEAQNRKAARGSSNSSGGRPNAARTKGLYEQNCARCHGADGRGQTELGELYGAKDLTDAKRLRGLGTKNLTDIIAHGKGGMPSFSKKLSKQEIAALVAYVRTLK
jgi:cbb3-type cytochrome c oxidase subunit III